MTDQQENTMKAFRKCCESMPFAEMMRKMMDQSGEGGGFDCAEMMQKMMTMCCSPADEKEETRLGKEAKETQTS